MHSVHSPKVSELVLVSVSSSISLTLGRKFAQIEVVVFLVMVVRQWEIYLMEGWTAERLWEVLDKSDSVLTLAPPGDIPMKFERRHLKTD